MSRLQTLFGVALVGVLVIVGLALAALGVPVLVSYLLLLTVVLSLLVRRARAARVPSGKTCSCCTSTVFDPVTVVDEAVR